jgi:hypothetical protein
VIAYREHGGSLMRAGVVTLSGSVQAHVRNYRRAGDRLSPGQRRRYRARIASLYFDLGYAHRRQGGWRAAVAAYRQSLRWEPRLRTAVAWLKAVLRSAGQRGR